MQQSLADKVAEWTIYAIRTFATLPYDLQVVPFVSDEDAQQERLIVKVEIGEQYLEADQGFNGVLTLAFKTTRTDANLANDLWAKVEEALIAGLQTTGSNTKALETFSRLDFITESAATTLDNSSVFRRYTRTIPLHAKLL